MKYKIVIFDMDGTILNTLDDIHLSTNYALKQNGLPERTFDEVRMFVGNGIMKLIERACPEGTDSGTIQKVFETFMAYYKEHSADNTRPYAGIPETVVALKKMGIKVAVSTNKAHAPAQELGKIYFNGAFDLIVGQQEGLRTKPSPDSVNKILNILGFSKEEAVYVGDSDVDFQTAANSHMDFIGVDWGFRGRAFLEKLGTKNIIDKPEEILDLVK